MSAIRKSKWSISSNKASVPTKLSILRIYVNSRERKIVLFIVTYDVCLKWEFPRSCLRRSVYSSMHCPYWILTACNMYNPLQIKCVIDPSYFLVVWITFGPWCCPQYHLDQTCYVLAKHLCYMSTLCLWLQVILIWRL